MKLTITTHLHFIKFPWEDKGKYELFSFVYTNDEHRIYVGSRDVEVEVPDVFDPRPQQIAILQTEKQNLMADHQKELTEIDSKISNLQALEYTP